MKVLTKLQLIQQIYSHREQIKALGIKKLGLFGSFVRQQQTPISDVDILIEFEHGQKTYDNFIQLAELLEKFLELKVELVTHESISPYIKPHILNEVEDVPLDN